jgi:hypothetical protein
MSSVTQWMLTAALGVAMCGCAPIHSALDAASAKAAEQRWLGEVRDGSTTAREITASLGEPTETFNGGTILAYRLIGVQFFGFTLPAHPRVIRGSNPTEDRLLAFQTEWDFVVVLDERRIVTRHKMTAPFFVWDSW